MMFDLTPNIYLRIKIVDERMHVRLRFIELNEEEGTEKSFDTFDELLNYLKTSHVVKDVLGKRPRDDGEVVETS